MHCQTCKKEQETITVGGEIYCATCSSLLQSNGGDAKKENIPKLEKTDNPIRTEILEPAAKKEDEGIKQLSQESHLPDVSKDDLEGSAILLDILKDNAKDSLDKKTLTEDKKLEEAAEEVLDLIEKSEPEPSEPKQTEKVVRKGNGVMNDISIGKRADHLRKGSHPVQTAEKEIKDEVKRAAKIVTSERGYTKEYDMIIMSIALTAVVLIIMVLFITFT